MQTYEGRLSTVEAILRRLDADVNGNGKPGLRDEVRELKGSIKAILWLTGIAVALLAVLMTYIGIRAGTNHAEISSDPTITAQSGGTYEFGKR